MIGHAISVRPTRLGHGLAGTEAIRDLIIEHNEFQDCGGAALFIGDASNVAVSNNRIHAAPDAERRRKAPRDPGRTQFSSHTGGQHDIRPASRHNRGG